MGRRTEELLAASDVMLLGRSTYLEHAGFWPTADGRMAELMNGIAKLVVTSTLSELSWSNSRRLSADLRSEVGALSDGDQHVLVAGSVRLVKTLLGWGGLDRLRLIVDPIVLGAGTRLFDDGERHALQLIEEQRFATGAVSLTYDIAADPAGTLNGGPA